MLESYCRPTLLVADGRLPFFHSHTQSVCRLPNNSRPFAHLSPWEKSLFLEHFCLGLLEILSWKSPQRPAQHMCEAMKRPQEFTARSSREFWVPPSSLPSTPHLPESLRVCLPCRVQGFLIRRGLGGTVPLCLSRTRRLHCIVFSPISINNLKSLDNSKI